MGHGNSTIFMGAYGFLRPHPWIRRSSDCGAVKDPPDGLALLVSRAEAMGFSLYSRALTTIYDPDHPPQERSRPSKSEDFDYGAANFWNIDEVDDSFADEEPAGLLLGCQVSVPNQPAIVSPVLALSACMRDVLARVGEPSLSGFQVVFPPQAQLWDNFIAHSSQILNWYTILTGPSTEVLVTLDSGDSPEIDLFDHKSLTDLVLSEWLDAGFSIMKWSSTGDDRVWLDPPVVDEWWLGQGHHEVTLTVQIPEWTLDALGCLTAWMMEACRRSGIKHGVRMSVAPA